MIYTAILVRDSHESYSGGYLDGSSCSETQVHCFTTIEELKSFAIPFLVESSIHAEKNREYSSHELTVLVNGIPGSSGENIYLDSSLWGTGAEEEATRLEVEIKNAVSASMAEARVKVARAANERRLKMERLAKEKKEREEREQLAELISRYGVKP